MNLPFSDSVVLITSRAAEKSRDFGTGFVIHREGTSTYLLTCAHVVEDVGGEQQVNADGISAPVVISGEDRGIDLAVLRVEGLLDKPTLKLCGTDEQGQSFIIPGCYEYASKTPLVREIRGNLGQKTQLISKDKRERINTWDLIIEGQHNLKPGYSGSPVIDIAKGCVMGITSYRKGEGKEGLAISVNALTKIWSQMPDHLIVNSPNAQSIPTLSNAMKRKIERLQRDLKLAQKQSDELTEIIEVIVDEINENQGDSLRQRNLNKKKSRYEEEREEYDQEVERLQTEIEQLLNE